MARPSRIIGYLLLLATVAIAGAWLTPARGPLCLPALALVLSGTLGFCLAVRQPTELQRLMAPLPESVAATPERLVALAARSWTQGGPGLDRELANAESEVEREALRLLAVGAKPPDLEVALRGLADLRATEARVPVLAWQTVAQGAAGTGAVVSLLVMARALTLPSASLQAADLAGGLAALAYGLILAQFLVAPRLAAGRRAADRVRADDRAWLEGLLAIAGGVHPRRLADRLSIRRAARAA